jgi:copper homeostasis protein
MPYMVQNPQLEIACFNPESALIAQASGADRVELCDGIAVGGTTPNFETVKQARENLSIDLYVMIRPRGGNFVYSEEEFKQMQSNILALKELKVDGFVFGILKEYNSVNLVQNKILVDLAKPLPCTFHRAFDEIQNPFQALEQLIECGFKTILTSGQAQNVTAGMNRLTELVTKANNRIAIMPGGGLRSTNIDVIREKTKAIFYHSSAITEENEQPNSIEIDRMKSILNQH